MDAEVIKWIYALKVGDKIYYQYRNNTIKMAIISGISVKCIYVNDLRIRKYSPISMHYYKGAHFCTENIQLINPNSISNEMKIKLECEFLIEKIIKEKRLEKLTLMELSNILYKGDN